MKSLLLLFSGLLALAALTLLLVIPGHGYVSRPDYEKQLVAMFSGYDIPRPAAEKGKPRADMPGAAALQDFLMTMDPALGYVPLDRRIEAWKVTDKMMNEQKLKSTQDLITWQGAGSVMGGRTRALMWDPNDANHKKVWAGAVTGGLWNNTDVTSQNTGWTAINDFWPGLSISCITYDPNNTQVFYAGTGEAQTAVTIYRESSGRGYGIWKSSDGGQSWSLLQSTNQFAYVTDIRVRNEGGTSVVYAGVVSGRYMGASHQSQPTDGLYRSADGGVTWTQVLPNIPGETKPFAVSDVDITADGTRIILGTMRNLDGKGGAYILYSDAGTAGTWTAYGNYNAQITSGIGNYNMPGRLMVACAPSNSNVVYGVIATGYNQGAFDVFHSRLLIKSTDKGASWTTKANPTGNPNQEWATIAWHALTIAVDPNNANTLWTGGLDLHRSTDGATSWTKYTDWAQMYNAGGPDYVHADQHNICYKPGSSSEIIFGSDGGVFYTSNATAGTPVFSERNKNFSTLQFYTGDISNNAPGIQLLGGLQDNGCLWYQGTPLGLTDMVSGGDGAYCFFDKDDPATFITSVYYNVYYVFNSGSFLNYISDWESGYFINPADYDSRFNTLYANASSMFGDHQDELLRIKDVDGNPQGEFIPLSTGSTVPYSHIKVSPNSTLTNIRVFVGTWSGRLFKLTNAQTVPVVTEIGSPSFPNAVISSVAAGHSDDTLLVTFSNYGVSSVWRTFNGGNSWDEIEGNLPDMPVRWAVFHPQNSEQALIATETGVWSSSNIFSTNVFWSPANTGMANVRTDMLSIRAGDNKMVAATHGRGLFYGTYAVDPTSSVNPNAQGSLRVFPNPTDGPVSCSGTAYTGPALVEVMDMSGKTVMREKKTINDGVRLDLSSLPAGNYLLKITAGNRVYRQKLTRN